MKQVIKYQSDDGSIHDKEVDALKADLAYWKKLGELELARRVDDEERSRYRQPYQERGSHQ